MNTEMQQTGLQKQLQIVMPIFMVGVTSFQPAALQLYFVFSAVLGGITSQLLRTPAIRRILGLRLLPSKESNELYSKVVKGEIKMSALRGPDGKIRYQAPGATKPSSTSSKTDPSTTPYTTSKSTHLNIKPGTQLPAHMRPAAPAKVPQNYADRDVDFETGMKELPLREKMDWMQRNYKMTYMWRRFKRWVNQDNRNWTVMMEDDRRKRAQQAEKKYEAERKRRLGV